MAGDDVIIVIRADNGQAVRAMRDTQGRLRDMRGRFIAEGRTMSGSMDGVTRSIGRVKGSLIPLATAGVPVLAKLGASTLTVAAQTGGATLAFTAFAAAVAGQVSSLSDAAKAHDKTAEAIVKHGKGSKQAAEAQRTLSRELGAMPPATARAAIGLQAVQDSFTAMSDEVSGFTMTPVEKTFTVLEQVIPKIGPMARDASEQLDRLVTVAGGAVGSPGFDAFSDRVAAFADRSLQGAVDGAIHLMRVLSEDEGGDGPLAAFMKYAEENGPAVKEALSGLGGAVSTLVEASAEAGPGMLTLVTAAAQLVEALPPELVATVMQLAVALKLVTLAGAGAAAAGTAVQALGRRIAAVHATSVAAGGGVAGLRAAFLGLGTAAKASIVVGAIAAVVVAFGKLGELGRDAPPDVDKLTTSLGQLGRTGKVSGEAARLFGEDLDGLYDSVRNITDPSVADNIQNGLVKVLSLGFADSTPSTEARKRLDAIDEGLTNLVRGGKADIAAAAFKRMKAEYAAGGKDVGEFTGQMGDYKSALADLKFEQDLIADSMGIFGDAAQRTSAKLEAQQTAADGLRAAILALNDVNRSAHDAQTKFEESLDALDASFKKHGATLNADTEAGRANRDAMSEAAAAHDEMIASGLAAGDSMASMTKESDGLRSSMMELATKAFRGNTEAAREYVDTLLGTPSEIKTLIKAEKEEAISGLEAVRAAIQATPDEKSVTVETLNGAAIAALEAVGYKTEQLPDGRTKVTAANGQALGAIGSVSSALNRLNGRTARTYTVHTTEYRIKGRPGGPPSGTYLGSTAGRSADGNIYGRAYANGGTEQHVAQIAQPTFRLWAEPETGGEAYIPLAESKRPRSVAILEEVADRFGYGLEAFAKGGTSKAKQRAKERAAAEKQARGEARGDLTISHFGQKAGNKNTEFANALGSPDSLRSLTSALNQWRSIIKKATHGGVESSLLKGLNSAGKALIKYEKQHEKITKTLEKAKALRDDVASGLRGEAGIVKSANASDSQTTINTIMSQMTASAANTKQFSQMLTQLRKKGLSGDLVAQIAQAGIEGGGMETAAALLGGGASEIKKINELQKQIKSAAKASGNAAADAMYGAGMKAGEGLIAGLEKQQKAIEKQMMKIAKSMEKAIKKALGIKSPSQVMMQVGDMTAEGFAQGMTRNRSVTPAWESMLNVPRPAGAAAGGGGGQPVIVHQTITLDGRVVAQQMFDPFRKEVSTRGGLKGTFPGDFR